MTCTPNTEQPVGPLTKFCNTHFCRNQFQKSLITGFVFKSFNTKALCFFLYTLTHHRKNPHVDQHTSVLSINHLCVFTAELKPQSVTPPCNPFGFIRAKNVATLVNEKIYLGIPFTGLTHLDETDLDFKLYTETENTFISL